MGQFQCAVIAWQVTEACWVLCDDCRRNGTRGRLGKVLERCVSWPCSLIRQHATTMPQVVCSCFMHLIDVSYIFYIDSATRHGIAVRLPACVLHGYSAWGCAL